MVDVLGPSAAQHERGDRLRTCVLAVAATSVERDIIRAWFRDHVTTGDPDCVLVDVGAEPSAAASLRSLLEGSLRIEEDVSMTPVRVAWRPVERRGLRRARLWDAVRLRDPYHPRARQQSRVVREAPDRYDLVVAHAATCSELMARYRTSNSGPDDAAGFTQFVGRQCVLALERAETQRYGIRHKLPRLVREEILASRRYSDGVEALSRRLDRPVEAVEAEAAEYLREMVATPSRMIVDVGVQFARLANRRKYGTNLMFDRDQLNQLRELSRAAPLALLPSHRSYLDYAVLATVLDESGLPPTAGLGGINLAFWPVGPLLRRAGMIFIRRSFRDNHVYKFVLRQYVGYLAEKRFSMMWSIEGTRTRTGKLVEPRMGLLAYVADAYLDRRCDDYYLVPLAIIYEELLDAQEHRAYALGGTKRAECLGWFIRYLRAQRRDYRNGHVHVGFGEPVSLRAALGPPRDEVGDRLEDDSIDLQKVAFEVSARINQATPVTATAMVTMVLLGAGRALSFEQLMEALAEPLDFVRRRRLPTPARYPASTRAGVEAALAALVRHGVVSAYPGEPAPLFAIEPSNALVGAYYRNSIAHFFLTASIAELAWLDATAQPAASRPEAIWASVGALRELLKLDFFFADRERYYAEVVAELDGLDPTWLSVLGADGTATEDFLRRARPLCTPLVLRPFLDAYLVVADALVAHGNTPLDDRQVLRECLDRSSQYVAQHRIAGSESRSQVIQRNAIKLASHRRLLDDDDGLADRRAAFAAELHRWTSLARRIGAWADERLDTIVRLDDSPVPTPERGAH